MNDDNSQILPEDFDGVFRFTNWTDSEFVGIWGKKEYHFPALTTSPMIMPEYSPVEIQNIRKKFAKDLGEREFYKSNVYSTMRAQEGTPNNRTMSGIHQAATYTDKDLAPFIQKCLEPLPVSRAVVTDAPTEKIEEKLTRNEDGELNTEAVDRKASLRKKALEA